ncbi:MAG: hypothetical protein P9F75_16175 [Candidatus Contendobacter sp.]|nr:hypothetical protein [Candidatus Contendobacter sp.]
MTDDDSLADSPASRAIRAIRALGEHTTATRVMEGLFSSLPRSDEARLLEVFQREREHKRTYEEAVIQLAQQQAIQPPPEPPPPRPKKRRESSRSRKHDLWVECAKTIYQEYQDKGKRPLNKGGIAQEVIDRLRLSDDWETVRRVLREREKLGQFGQFG